MKGANKDVASEEFVDMGWHISLRYVPHGVEYEYTELCSGEKITGSASAKAFTSAQQEIRQHLKQRAELQEQRAAGVFAGQIGRRIMDMVGILHDRGYQSLYLDSYLASTGFAWRFEIGAMDSATWPVSESRLLVRGSISGGFQQQLEWARVTDPAIEMADKFVSRYARGLDRAREPNPEYAAWYRQMFESTKPEGLLIFSCDMGPVYEYAFALFEPRDFRMPMPPGFVRPQLG